MSEQELNELVAVLEKQVAALEAEKRDLVHQTMRLSRMEGIFQDLVRYLEAQANGFAEDAKMEAIKIVKAERDGVGTEQAVARASYAEGMASGLDRAHSFVAGILQDDPNWRSRE